ncbi:ArsA family ATPase [Svornostia abyssi]|uniref:ArsA family ATPase n=1 Tax=Svornostia abyssi TaxID=2898438 RepID=A0ABY5PFS8_9ACTN|nr:ArsA family ATPase [Parviterribacteraceae bacterium J379]
MGPRIILYTGKGGVGKTSVAAATARRAAAAGHRTLLLSTDPAGSLGDVLGRDVGPEPAPASEGLWAQQVEARDEIERNWGEIRDWLAGVLSDRGMERIRAEELAMPPGLHELVGLLELRRHAEEAVFDVVVVDCAASGETLRLLALPDAARWWLDRAVGNRRALDAARPIARAALDITLPSNKALDGAGGLLRDLVALCDVLRDHERVSLRLVMTPDRMVIDEARRTFTYLNLYGLLTDAIVVNRVFPEEVGAYFDAWRARQAEALTEVGEAFAPLPLLRAPYFGEEVVGDVMLDRLAEQLFTGVEAPIAVLHDEIGERLELGDDEARLMLTLPFAQKGDVTLRQVGEELVIRIDGHTRTVLLPPALQDYRPAGAALADGALTVTFDPPAPTP